jgi:hypothetical protein
VLGRNQRGQPNPRRVAAAARAHGFGCGVEARRPAASAGSRWRARRAAEEAQACAVSPEVSTKAAASGAGRRLEELGLD